MIDEALLKSGVVGKDGFSWWIGRVAHPDVWDKKNRKKDIDGQIAQRCKVRIVGYHPWDDSLKEEELPWAQVLMDPITGSGQGGLGDVMTLVGGETCVGFFLDGDEGQQPVIMGLLHRHEQVKNEVKSRLGSTFGGTLSTEFKTITGNTENIPQSTKEVASGGTVGNSSQTKGSVSSRSKGSGTEPSTNLRAHESKSGQSVEKKGLKTWNMPSTCSDDAIGGITQALTDFITMTNGIEQGIGGFIDPIRNKVINMEREAKKVARKIGAMMKMVINNIRDGIISKILSLFAIFQGAQKKVNPADLITGPAADKASDSILDILFCLFEKIIGIVINMAINMLKKMISSVVNGPVCAAEQLVSGLLEKAINAIENIVGPIMEGIDWLTGGLGNIRSVISNVSNLASSILSFIGCDEKKCTKPSTWSSKLSGSIGRATDNWQSSLEGANVFGGIQKELDGVIKDVGEDKIAKWIAGGELNRLEDIEVADGRSNLLEVLQATDAITGGNSREWANSGLGSLESALSTMTLFGKGHSIFDACNQRSNNPQTQDDLIDMPIGFVYEKCIPPKVEVLGSGSGADLHPVVGSDGRLFSVEVIHGGSGYDDETNLTVVEKSNCGSGAIIEPIISPINDDGTGGIIEDVVIIIPGFGYVGDGPAVGIVTDVISVSPGIGYTTGDSVLICDNAGICTTAPVVVTPGNGSIIDVNVPTDFGNEFNSRANLTIISDTGTGARLVPIMRSSVQLATDSAVRPLVGITSVIDCPPEDHINRGTN